MRRLGHFVRGSTRAAILSAALVAGTFGGLGTAAALAADPPATAPAAPGDDRVRHMDREMERYRGEGQRGRGGYADRFDDLGNGNSADDFPTDALQSAAAAYGRYAAARAAYDRADHALAMAVREAESTFENSAELRSAQTDERKAYEDLTTARKAAIAKLLDDAKYRAARTLRDQMSDKISRRRSGMEVMMATPSAIAHQRLRPERDRNEPDYEMMELLPMAMTKLGFATTVTAMEVIATVDDPRVQEAQMRLVSAGSRVSEMRKTHAEQMRGDERLAAARKALDDARFARSVAAGYADGAIAVGNEALDYTYWRHRRTAGSSGYAGDGDYGYGLGTLGYGFPFVGSYPVTTTPPRGGGRRERPFERQ